jgi:hypothetical protein
MCWSRLEPSGWLQCCQQQVPRQAPREAWVRAIIVPVSAVLPPMRLRAAQGGSVAALRAVGLISSALFLVNVVEAASRSSCPCGCGSRRSGSPG